jgi:hypothetical protein
MWSAAISSSLAAMLFNSEEQSTGTPNDFALLTPSVCVFASSISLSAQQHAFGCSSMQSTYNGCYYCSGSRFMFALACSLPLLLKAKGRAAWDAVQANLLQMLQKLDLEAQVHMFLTQKDV